MRLFAAIRALEVISEASRRLPNEMKDRHSQIDWAAVAAAGNIYRHEYDVVNPRRIWRTTQGGRSRMTWASSNGFARTSCRSQENSNCA
jgi:uncharacterized protein with HEPN domain